MVKTKTCAYCKVNKPLTLTHFCKYSYSADGFNSRCKQCEKDRRNGVLKRLASAEQKLEEHKLEEQKRAQVGLNRTVYEEHKLEEQKHVQVGLYRTVYAEAKSLKFVVKPVWSDKNTLATHIQFTSNLGEDFEIILTPVMKVPA